MVLHDFGFAFCACVFRLLVRVCFGFDFGGRVGCGVGFWLCLVCGLLCWVWVLECGCFGYCNICFGGLGFGSSLWLWLCFLGWVLVVMDAVYAACWGRFAGCLVLDLGAVGSSGLVFCGGWAACGGWGFCFCLFWAGCVPLVWFSVALFVVFCSLLFWVVGLVLGFCLLSLVSRGVDIIQVLEVVCG